MIIAAIATIVAVVGIFLFYQSHTLDSVYFNVSEITLNEGETTKVYVATKPSSASIDGHDIRWYSSDVNVAKTKANGEVEAISKGTCTLSLTWDGEVVDTCDVTVEYVIPEFKEIYEKLDAPSYATVASDGSYLFLDTNPDDTLDFTDESAIVGMYVVHRLLELPESVINEMGQTRAMDGVQEYTNDYVCVKWRYHPDKGLEVTYTWR